MGGAEKLREIYWFWKGGDIKVLFGVFLGSIPCIEMPQKSKFDAGLYLEHNFEFFILQVAPNFTGIQIMSKF